MKENRSAHRRFSHLTPHYVVCRLAVMLDERKHPENPWLTADAVAILTSLLRPSDVGVEFGSGRSTKWFAQRLQKLTSIENNPAWFEKVQQGLISLPGNVSVDYRLCVSDEDYASQAWTFSDNSIDFCLVDGAVRDRCALAMLPKVRRGGRDNGHR